MSSVYENPRYFGGPPLLARQKVRARDGKTWKAGQPMVIDSGLYEPVASGGTKCHGFASEDIDTATSSTDVYIDMIQSTETVFAAYVTYTDSDYTSKRSQIGLGRGIRVTSNVATVNVIDDTNALVVVRRPMWELETYNMDSTDSPGQVTFTFKASALE